MSPLYCHPYTLEHSRALARYDDAYQWSVAAQGGKLIALHGAVQDDPEEAISILWECHRSIRAGDPWSSEEMALFEELESILMDGIAFLKGVY